MKTLNLASRLLLAFTAVSGVIAASQSAAAIIFRPNTGGCPMNALCGPSRVPKPVYVPRPVNTCRLIAPGIMQCRYS